MSDAETEEITLDTSSNEGDLSAGAHDAHEFEKRLIEEVKQRPFLYDHTNGGFKDLKKKDAAWAQVSEAVANSVNKCQCRWKSLRDRYVRESRKMREGNGPKRHLWEMFKYLTFLDDIPRLHRGGYVEHPIWATKSGRVSGKRPAVFVMPTSSPQQTPPTVQLTVGSAASTSYNTQTLVAAPAAITPTSSTSAPALTVQLAENPTLPVTNRKSNSGTLTNSNSNGTNVVTNNNNNNNHILTTFVDMADGCSAFGMSVSATLRTLPLAQQELAKLRIQQVLYEVQFS